MNRPWATVTTLIVAALMTACGSATSNQSKPVADIANVSNANIAAKPATAAPSKEAIMAAETRAWESWKAKDGKYFEDYLSDNAFAIGDNGRIDRATIVKRHVDPTCEVNSFLLSEQQMITLSADVALVTYKAAQDAKCGGKAMPSPVWAATVLVRKGDTWKAAYHNENAVVDPKTLTTKKADRKSPADDASKTALTDAGTSALLAKEKAVWEAWKDHDGKRIEDLTAENISFINIFGTFLPNKPEAIRDWTSNLCQVKSVTVTNAEATMLTPTVGILTFKGGADGLCGGQPVPPIWGTSIYVKEGDQWKWSFGMNSSAG